MVKGILPVYKIPEVKSSKLDNRLAKVIEDKLLISRASKKNFVVDNIKRNLSPTDTAQRSTRIKSPS